MGNQGEFIVGSNVFSFDFSDPNFYFCAIVFGETTVLGMAVEDGFLILDVSLSDKAGREILRIERGEMTIATGQWDVQAVGRNVKLRCAPRNVELDMNFTDNGLNILQGTLYANGRSLLIKPGFYQISPGGSIMSGCRISGFGRGLVVA